MKKTKKVLKKKPVRLMDKLVKTLSKQKKPATYGALAVTFKTNARAVGQAVKALAKIHPALASKVIYNTTTRPKKYKTK